MFGNNGDSYGCLEIGCTERYEPTLDASGLYAVDSPGWTSYALGMVCPMHSTRAKRAAAEYAVGKGPFGVLEAFMAGVAWMYHEQIDRKDEA